MACVLYTELQTQTLQDVSDGRAGRCPLGKGENERRLGKEYKLLRRFLKA